jgi:hypothetical protein
MKLPEIGDINSIRKIDVNFFKSTHIKINDLQFIVKDKYLDKFSIGKTSGQSSKVSIPTEVGRKTNIWSKNKFID